MTARAPVDPQLARRVAGEWFDAWNRHDLDAVQAKIVRVVAHYEAQAGGD